MKKLICLIKGHKVILPVRYKTIVDYDGSMKVFINRVHICQRCGKQNFTDIEDYERQAIIRGTARIE